MRVLLSMYGSRGDVEPILGLAVQLRAEECDAPVATGVMSTGVMSTGVVRIGVWR